jgi:hypothetical protein
MSAPTETKAYRILVYGIETKGLPRPAREVVQRKYTLSFTSRKEAGRFQDFDGVIVFQGSFESFELRSSSYGSYLKHDWDRDELDKRTKETQALIEKGGLICLLLTDKFIDFDERRQFGDTDLSKRLLSWSEMNREEFGTRMTQVRSKVNELLEFFKIYGAAWTYLLPRYKEQCKTLASVPGGRSVSVIAHGSLFVIPTLLPNHEAIEEYFTMLANGVVLLWERLKEDLPEWATQYRFPSEAKLLDDKVRLSDALSNIDMSLSAFDRLKRVLVLNGESLVDAVIEVFNTTLPLTAQREEAFREDLTLVDSNGKVVALVEVKGGNKGGVQREQVNQADSHRARAGLAPDFPSLLIVNTNIKASMSIADKDQPVAPEQIQHAARMNILILRTLDLLNLASLLLSGKLSPGDVVELLTESSGWLRVGDTAEVLGS